MKKAVSLLILIALVFSVMPAVSAAGYGSLSGPSTVRAGDTITLSYIAGGGIYGGSGTVSYDSSVLTLQSYSASVGGSWAVEFSGNSFVFYDNSMTNPISGATIFTATFLVNGNVSAGTNISVSVSGTVSDGTADNGASGSWSATIAPPLSGNCDLGSLTVSGATISPAFNAGTTTYNASAPFTTSSIQVSATAADEKAMVSVNNPQLIAGGTTAITVKVTAENGATKTYTIHVKRAQDPNYVPSSIKTLDSLVVADQVLSPLFSADVTQYYVWLPYETETVSISAKVSDPKASVSVGEISTLAIGKATPIAVTVTAEDKTQQVYTVTVFRAPAHEDTEAFLQGARTPEETLPEEIPETQPTEPETEPSFAPEPTQLPTESVVTETSTVPASFAIWKILLFGGVGLLIGGAVCTGIFLPKLLKRKNDEE